MSNIELTDQQREAVLNDMDKKTEMLTFEDVEAIATKLNEKIDIPFIPEGVEQAIFVKTVIRFDRLLYQNLPNEIYSLVKNASDGISNKDAEQLKNVLGTRLNNKFDMPYVPEWVEQEIFDTLIDLIVGYMRKTYSVLDERA